MGAFCFSHLSCIHSYLEKVTKTFSQKKLLNTENQNANFRTAFKRIVNES